MFGWFRKNKVEELSEKTQEAFSSVKKDIDSVSKWIKHLDAHDKQLFDIIYGFKQDLSSLTEEVESLREALAFAVENQKSKQAFKKLPVLSKQTSVEDVQEVVQTVVQTDNFYEIIKSLSGNERLVVFTLLNNEMKLSYEDLALLLGKDKSTIRGQINAIKQKSEGLIEELTEKNGKKRVYLNEKIKEKLQKYGKVRVGSKKK